MTKEQQRSEDRDAEGVAVLDKQDKQDKAVKPLKASEAAEPVAITTNTTSKDTEHNASEAAQRLATRVLEQIKPSAWVPPLTTTWNTWVQKATTPRPRPLRVDVISRNDDVLVRAEVSGISKERLDLAVNANALTIRGQASTLDAGDYLRRELPHGEVSRHIALPFEVEGDKATATIRQGLLEVVLPKASKARPQKIAIH